MAVEAGVVLAERGPGLPGEPQTLRRRWLGSTAAASAARSGGSASRSARDRPGSRRWPAASTWRRCGGGCRRRARTSSPVTPPLSVRRPRPSRPQDLAPRAEDDLLARGDVGGGVDAPATAVAQDRPPRRRRRRPTTAPIPRRRRTRRRVRGAATGRRQGRPRRAPHPTAPSRGSRRSGPTRRARRPARRSRRSRRRGWRGCGGEAGHAATDDGEIELLRGGGHTLRIVDVADDVKSSS